MSPITLDSVLAFNEEIFNLSNAGVPIVVNAKETGEALQSQLERINARFAMQAGKGRSLNELVDGDNELPTTYRAAVRMWAQFDQPTLALDTLITANEARHEVQRGLGRSIVQPLIVFVFTYFGFISLCFLTAPAFAEMYAQIWQTPSRSVMFLMWLRAMFPIWSWLVPLLLVVAIILFRRRGMQHRLLWLFGTDTFFALTRQAVYAESLASMLDQGLNREAAMSLAGVVPNQPSTTQMPSLLNWALTTEANEADAAETLRFVSRAYRQIAERRASLRQVWLPVVLGAVLGGSCVLLFGLSLFLPYIQLLKHLTLPWEI